MTVWIDADCSLCSRVGRWLLRRAKQRGIELQVRALPPKADALVLEYGGQRFEAAEALRTVLWLLGGWLRWAARLLSVLPVGVRQWCYRQVARRRFWLSGKRCPVPLEES